MLAYERCGAGEPVVLIHGIGHRRQAWSPVVDALAERYDVVLVDLPGHGDSPTGLLGSMPAKEALDAEFRVLFDHLGLDSAHLVGNSLGGLVALELAEAGLARSVTALSPAGFWAGRLDFAYVQALFGSVLTIARVTQPIAPRILRSPVGRTAMLAWLMARPWRVDPDQATGDLENLVATRATLRGLLAQAYAFEPDLIHDVPVTVAWAGRDGVLLPYQARRARTALHAARHVRLPGCGHVPMSDDPALVVDAIVGTVEAAAAADRRAA